MQCRRVFSVGDDSVKEWMQCRRGFSICEDAV